MNHFINLLEKYAAVSGNAEAIISGSEIITYSRLNVLVNQTASGLLSMGLKQGSKVAVLSSNNSSFIILVLALWKIAAVPMPLNTRLLPSEIQNILNRFHPDCFFIHENIISSFKDSSGAVQFPFGINSKKITVPRQMQNDEAVIIFTSGTAGNPKGVTLTFNNLINNCISGNNAILQFPGDKWLLSLPVFHIGGFSIIARALYFGTSIAIPNSVKADDIIDAINKYNPTHISLVPTQLKRILENGIKPNAAQKSVLVGGGPTENDLILSAYNAGWKVIKVYGSTETTAFITALPREDFLQNYGSVGKPLKGTEIKIVKSADFIYNEEYGEIHIKSPSVMKYYLYNEEETYAKIKDGFYNSGDIGYLDKNGFLYIESRRTDLIISGGENINPLEVERVLAQHPNISSVCVFALNDKEWGQCVAAAVMVKENALLSELEITDYLSGKLASYKIPKKVFFTNTFPLTSLGKIKRQEVANSYNSKS